VLLQGSGYRRVRYLGGDFALTHAEIGTHHDDHFRLVPHDADGSSSVYPDVRDAEMPCASISSSCLLSNQSCASAGDPVNR
jgi:hypothetical protein